MLIDTNVLIAYGKGMPEIVSALSSIVHQKYISRINYMEFLAHADLSVAEQKKAKQFLKENFKLIEIDELIADKAIEIRAEKNLKLPDAIIIATGCIAKLKIFTLDIELQKKYPDIVISQV